MQKKYKDKYLSPKERAEHLLSLMTLQEKIGQLNQRLYGFSIYERKGEQIELSDEFKEEVEKYSGLGVLYGLYRADPWSGKDFKTGLTKEIAVKAYNQVQRYVIEHSRLGIPMLMSSECPHGHQALDGYLLPVNLAMGATFHPELVEQSYHICGKQLNKMGVHMALISNLDVLRDPRWGRSEECFSEDPFLTASFARASVKAIQAEGVAVVAKHFCAQGECTGGINASAARIGERELREIHLPAMKACCEVGVEGVMAAYNEIDGIFCHANHKLLDTILRKEMGFQGVVMSDGVAIDQLDVMTGDRVLSGAKALKAGVDIGLWDTAFGKLKEAVELGYITEADIDQAVLRVLTMKFEKGLFDQPYLEEDNKWMAYHYKDYPQALQLARESAVLLKNESNILPLSLNSIQSIAIIGPNANEIYHQLGDYTPPVREEDGVTALRGIQEWIRINKADFSTCFASGGGIFESSQEELEEAVSLAKACDITILVLGGSSSRFGEVSFDTNGAAMATEKISMDCGEGVDCATLQLPENQSLLAEQIFALGKTVITTVIAGRPYEIENLAEKSNALIYQFYPGMKGGQALAEILFGEISPSGRLPVSIPSHVGQVPVYYNYKSSYRAMNYYDLEKKPLFTFGEGLSYTKFAYRDIQLLSDDISFIEDNPLPFSKGDLIIQFVLENVGDYDSFAVPQIYIRHLQSSVIPRIRELKGFKKIWLQKDQSLKQSIIIHRDDFAVWNQEMKYEVEAGKVELYLCDSGKEIWKQVVLIA